MLSNLYIVIALIIFGCGSNDSQKNKKSGAPADNDATPPQTVISPEVNSVANAPMAPAFTKKRIEFAGSAGDRVPGYLWLPDNAVAGSTVQKLPAALVMYGINGDKDDNTIRQVAEKLNQSGVITMTIDWPGTGERGHIDNARRILGEGFDQTIKDYKLAIDYLSAQPQVDASKIAYVGASWGANTGLAFSAQDARIRAVVSIVPVPNPLLGDNSPNIRIKQVAPRPLLCIFSEGGIDMSSTVCADGQSASAKLIGYPGADHELSNSRDKVAQETTAFLLSSLK